MGHMGGDPKPIKLWELILVSIVITVMSVMTVMSLNAFFEFLKGEANGER